MPDNNIAASTVRDFSAFTRAVNQKRKVRIPTSAQAYSRWGTLYRGPLLHDDDFTIDEIKRILRSGEISALQQLSRYFYRTNNVYRNNIDYLAHLSLYENMVIPIYEGGKGSQTQITKAFYSACEFIENLDLVNTLTHVTTQWLIDGVYNGLLREGTDGRVTLHDLPREYCRTRFKDLNNLNILEFNIRYFNTISDEDLRLEALSTFPLEIQQAWKAWNNPKSKDKELWVAVSAASGGVCFVNTIDSSPLLVASIPELKKMDDATAREEKRDDNELYKLLIQRLPIGSNGELVFQLPEAAQIHAGTADMLADIDTVDVLTVFGETSLESLQETSSATQANDRLAKYRKNAWDALGRGNILFNPENSSTLAYQIKKDEALMISYLNVYETWIRFLLNERFARKGVTFNFEILPTTVFNRNDLQSAYFRAAQYGYSKMMAGVAMGMKQRELLSLMDFENNFLDMSVKMVPLQSSYTTSNSTDSQQKNNSGAQKIVKTSKSNNINNEGGRPELPDEQKSEKTQANIAAMG